MLAYTIIISQFHPSDAIRMGGLQVFCFVIYQKYSYKPRKTENASIKVLDDPVLISRIFLYGGVPGLFLNKLYEQYELWPGAKFAQAGSKFWIACKV